MRGLACAGRRCCQVRIACVVANVLTMFHRSDSCTCRSGLPSESSKLPAQGNTDDVYSGKRRLVGLGLIHQFGSVSKTFKRYSLRPAAYPLLLLALAESQSRRRRQIEDGLGVGFRKVREACAAVSLVSRGTPFIISCSVSSSSAVISGLREHLLQVLVHYWSRRNTATATTFKLHNTTIPR